MGIGSQKESAVRVAMHGRLLRCAMGGNPLDCPLHDIRLLPFEDRLAWLDAKSDFELTVLFGYHVQCLEHKKVNA
jgi:hypothetical protein